jgi:hypothetical protein
MSSHPKTCTCSIHAPIAATRHLRYRQLAHVILGPGAPRDDLALAQALAEHATRLALTRAVKPIRRHRAA